MESFPFIFGFCLVLSSSNRQTSNEKASEYFRLGFEFTVVFYRVVSELEFIAFEFLSKMRFQYGSLSIYVAVFPFV